MTSLIRRVRQWLADEAVVYECRRCGTTLDGQQDACSVCGSDEIARYDLG
jgi:ribosomal protein L37E